MLDPQHIETTRIVVAAIGGAAVTWFLIVFLMFLRDDLRKNRR